MLQDKIDSLAIDAARNKVKTGPESLAHTIEKWYKHTYKWGCLSRETYKKLDDFLDAVLDSAVQWEQQAIENGLIQNVSELIK